MKKMMNYLLGILLLITFGFPLHAQEIHEIEHEGLPRAYTINIPGTYDGETPIPLVIVLHGAGEDSITMQLTTQFADFGEESGYFVVFPNGVSNGWDYLEADDQQPLETHVDDVGFISKLIDTLIAEYAVDEERIYLIGYSNGALLALRLGCDLAERLDGVVSIAGTYSYEMIRHCAGQPPVPILFVWGTEDSAFPTGGYVIEQENGRIRSSFSLAQTRSYLITHYGCETRPQAIRIESESSPYPVVSETYSDCIDGSTARLLVLVDHDHGFPIAPRMMLADGTFGSTQEAIWDFIQEQAATP